MSYPEFVYIEAEDRRIRVQVRVSSRAKKLRLLATGEGIRLVIPKRTKWMIAERFVLASRSWIFETQARVDQRQRLLDLGVIDWRGEQFSIVESDDRSGVCLGQGVIFAGHPEKYGRRMLVEKWMRGRARSEFESKIDTWGQLMDLMPEKLRVADQRSRWGSCSSRKTLSLNWRLMMAPESVLDYIVIHELAHLKEMNHSSRFWQLVAQFCPEYRQAEKWLKENGPRLMQRPN